jgi:Tetracyclin repressor-like, C-terminal domain
VLFTRQARSALPSVAADAAAVFTLLIQTIEACVAAKRSASRDPGSDAVGLWLGLHGLAALPPATRVSPGLTSRSSSTSCSRGWS